MKSETTAAIGDFIVGFKVVGCCVFHAFLLTWNSQTKHIRCWKSLALTASYDCMELSKELLLYYIFFSHPQSSQMLKKKLHRFFYLYNCQYFSLKNTVVKSQKYYLFYIVEKDTKQWEGEREWQKKRVILYEAGIGLVFSFRLKSVHTKNISKNCSPHKNI